MHSKGSETYDSSIGELGELEHSHGSVPDDGLGVGQGLVEDLEGLGADVETHPVLWDRVDIDGLMKGTRICQRTLPSFKQPTELLCTYK